MTKPNILIASLSGRSLAASALKAGYAPLVVDAFGDADLQTHAHDYRHLPETNQSGFNRNTLFEALNALSQSVGTKPIGLVLGTGFEDQPNLIKQLENNFTLLGNNSKTTAQTKDPINLQNILRDRGIPHPPTSLSQPEDPKNWITKKIGGSGGRHISNLGERDQSLNPKANQAPQTRYFQRKEIGIPLTVAGVVSSRGFAIGICRQWLAPTPNEPYRFGGIVSPLNINPDTEARMVDIAVELTTHLNLKGFVSFDFVATKDHVMLLEINPRPTAALDILDDDQGYMFKAHIAACQDHDPSEVVAPRSGQKAPETETATRAIAYLYADHGELEIKDTQWPDWATDRPTPGTRIKPHQPIATVTATAENNQEAENLCRKRLGELNRVLYDLET